MAVYSHRASAILMDTPSEVSPDHRAGFKINYRYTIDAPKYIQNFYPNVCTQNSICKYSLLFLTARLSLVTKFDGQSFILSRLVVVRAGSESLHCR